MLNKYIFNEKYDKTQSTHMHAHTTQPTESSFRLPAATRMLVQNAYNKPLFTLGKMRFQVVLKTKLI
jgi:hypothetical protein